MIKLIVNGLTIGLASGATWLFNHGYVTQSGKAMLLGGGGIALAWLVNHIHLNATSVQGFTQGIKVTGTQARGPIMALVSLLSFASLLSLTGCVSSTGGTGHVVSITARGVGLKVTSSDIAANGTPSVCFGFFSSTVVLTPTFTNSVYSPNYANTFDFDQTGPLDMGIAESVATGSYQTARAVTNGVTSQPIVPTPH